MSSAATDHAGLVVLSFEECLELMAANGVGRVAFLADGEIEVLPVNYTIDGARVAFRTAAGSKLEAAVERAVVAFEVDAYEAGERTGWSVVIKGQAEVVSDEALIARLERSGLKPWATAVPKPEWVVIHPTAITGRRVPAGQRPARAWQLAVAAHVDEPAVVPLEGHGDHAGRAVSLLGDDEVGLSGAR
jgi:nitroimidazol reductase NimA-like FMN-containing flavoprotein (pyridoxamine 5'-phosphate oxidase superfamily)